MDTKVLRYFQCVYEEQSINRASRHLFITPQGLSKAIQSLEEELKTELFVRTHKGMEPTESGTYLYTQVPSVLKKIGEISAAIERIDTQQEKVIMGFSCGVLNVFPIEKITAIRKACGRAEIQWNEYRNDEVIPGVKSGRFDIGFVIGHIADKDLQAIELYSRNLDAILYEGHPLYDREKLSVGDLRGETFITLNENYYSYQSFKQRCEDFGFTPQILVKTMESKLIYRFCRQKLGVGIDVNIHKEDFNIEHLRRIELFDSIPWKISAICRTDRCSSPLLKKIRRILLDE